MTDFPSGTSVRSDTMGIGAAERVDVKAPSQMPTEMLRKVGSMCPRNGLFGYFIPEHRQALLEMRKLFLGEFSCVISHYTVLNE
jgi:GR25 family glycosyltransferase involved in LPS biosynthesis